MTLEFITLSFMAATVFVKWLTVSALRDKQARLAETNGRSGLARQRLKVAMNESAIADREIEKNRRKIRSSEHRIERLEKELEKLNTALAEQDEINREKLKLAEELRKKQGLI